MKLHELLEMLDDCDAESVACIMTDAGIEPIEAVGYNRGEGGSLVVFSSHCPECRKETNN